MFIIMELGLPHGLTPHLFQSKARSGLWVHLRDNLACQTKPLITLACPGSGRQGDSLGLGSAALR